MRTKIIKCWQFDQDQRPTMHDAPLFLSSDTCLSFYAIYQERLENGELYTQTKTTPYKSDVLAFANNDSMYRMIRYDESSDQYTRRDPRVNVYMIRTSKNWQNTVRYLCLRDRLVKYVVTRGALKGTLTLSKHNRDFMGTVNGWVYKAGKIAEFKV